MKQFTQLMDSFGLKYTVFQEGHYLVPGATHAVKIGVQVFVFNEDTFLALRVSLG